MYTTIPALVIALILYAIMGARFAGGTIDAAQIGVVLKG
jgi:Na+:H+ antiporter, NhaC family